MIIANRRKSLRSALAAVIAACLALFVGAMPAAAEPGLWVVKGPHSTIYLFGTIHILPKDRAWKSPAIAKALASSRELWLEAADIGDTRNTRKLVEQTGFDALHPLSTKLSEADLTRVDSVAKTLGIPAGERALEPMRPWLVSVTLAREFLVHAGFDPESGVEQVLLHDKSLRGKPVHGFETAAQQVHFFADLAPALEAGLLENMLQDFDAGPAKFDALIDGWMKGDDAAVARLVVDELKEPFPQLYHLIFVARNARWADAIKDMLKHPGVSFVAVGAGHLAGPDSVQHALESRGVHVERVNAPVRLSGEEPVGGHAEAAQAEAGVDPLAAGGGTGSAIGHEQR
jgi:uncharacterized protein YbaP (TraB family)